MGDKETDIWKFFLDSGKISHNGYENQFIEAGQFKERDKIAMEISEGQIKYFRNNEFLGIAFADPLFDVEVLKPRMYMGNKGDFI